MEYRNGLEDALVVAKRRRILYELRSRRATHSTLEGAADEVDLLSEDIRAAAARLGVDAGIDIDGYGVTNLSLQCRRAVVSGVGLSDETCADLADVIEELWARLGDLWLDEDAQRR